MRVERRARGEVRVQVLVVALDDPPRGRGQLAQRRAHSARPQRRRRGEVARAGQRAAPGEPEQVAQAAAALVAREHVDVEVVGRLGVRVRGRLRGLHAHVVAEPAQRLQLVDDERLRQLRPLVKDEQQPHGRPDCRARGPVGVSVRRRPANDGRGRRISSRAPSRWR